MRAKPGSSFPGLLAGRSLSRRRSASRAHPARLDWTGDGRKHQEQGPRGTHRGRTSDSGGVRPCVLGGGGGGRGGPSLPPPGPALSEAVSACCCMYEGEKSPTGHTSQPCPGARLEKRQERQSRPRWGTGGQLMGRRGGGLELTGRGCPRLGSAHGAVSWARRPLQKVVSVKGF